MSEQNQPEKKNFQHRMAVPGKRASSIRLRAGFLDLLPSVLFYALHGQEAESRRAIHRHRESHVLRRPDYCRDADSPLRSELPGKIELAKAPVVGKLLMHLHMIPVDRHHSDMEAMRACLRVTKAGGVLGIFPKARATKRGLWSTLSPAWR